MYLLENSFWYQTLKSFLAGMDYLSHFHTGGGRCNYWRYKYPWKMIRYVTMDYKVKTICCDLLREGLLVLIQLVKQLYSGPSHRTQTQLIVRNQNIKTDTSTLYIKFCLCIFSLDYQFLFYVYSWKEKAVGFIHNAIGIM